jgi:hypothetical protein
LAILLQIAIGGENMVTKIQKWGNSQGLRLARQMFEDAHLAVGDFEIFLAVIKTA